MNDKPMSNRINEADGAHQLCGRRRDGGDDRFREALSIEMAGMRRYSRRLCTTHADADDLLQETLAKCWKSRSSFDLDTSLGAWTRVVMRNAHISERRRLRYRFESDLGGAVLDVAIPPDQERVVLSHQIAEALLALSPVDQEVLALVAEGLSYAEIGVRSGISVGGVKTRVHRARGALHRRLSPEMTSLALGAA